MITAIHILVVFLIAALTGMGVGSAGLFVLWLTLVTDLAQRSAQGLNLGFFLIASLSSMVIHLRTRILHWQNILICALCGALGAWLGSLAAVAAPEIWLRRLFGAMMILAGATGLLKQSKNRKNFEKDDKNLP